MKAFITLISVQIVATAALAVEPSICAHTLAQISESHLDHSNLVEIPFYKKEGLYGEFSNFFSAPIILDGKVWPTSEHYYQAMKFRDLDHQEALRNAQTPMEVATLGRDRSKPLRSDWDGIKDAVMFDVVVAKFTQHPELTKLLLATGDAILIEHTENDSYWADGGDGSGKNMLGKILMEVREIIREQKYPQLKIPEFKRLRTLSLKHGYRSWILGSPARVFHEISELMDTTSPMGKAFGFRIEIPIHPVFENDLKTLKWDQLESRRATQKMFFQDLYNIGGVNTLLVERMPFPEEPIYNRIPIGVVHADGSSLTESELKIFEEELKGNLPKTVNRKKMDWTAVTSPQASSFEQGLELTP